MIEFFVGVAAGISITIWYIRRAFRQALGSMLQNIESTKTQSNHANSKDISARVECIDEVFYLYDSLTENFLAQGRTALEIENKLNRSIKTVRIVQGDLDSVEKFKKTLS